MAVSTASVTLAQATDAAFRAWGKALSDALTAVGLPKTTDTGQVDWATVLKPAAINTAQGDENRRFDDTLQASYPIFMKIEWGSGGGATYPSLWVTFGTARDGAGNLTGITSVRKQLNLGAVGAGNSTLYVCGDTNRVVAMLNVDVGANTLNAGFAIERTHDSAGADTPEGFIFLTVLTAGASTQGAFIFGTGVVNPEAALGALLPSVGTGASGASVALYPIFCSKGVYLNPFLNVLVAFAANVTAGIQLSFTYYGATRAFLPLANPPAALTVRGAVAGACFLVRND